MPFELHRFQGAGCLLGEAIGRRFAAPIRAALEDNDELRDVFRPYHLSDAGQERYRALLALHEQRYPGYLEELRGLAAGAAVAFEDLFLINLRGEYRGYAGAGRAAVIGECSTCTLLTDDHAVFGHNEDGAAYYRDRSYLIRVDPPLDAAYVALCYPGFLPSNAFGVNRQGLCYAINNVRPAHIEFGLGRHFLARSLLRAGSLEEAVAALNVTPRAAGFNFTLASIPERKILNVEVSPGDIHVQALAGRYFHANHYLHLRLDQQREPSSLARQRRGEELLRLGAPADGRGVLEVLHDQADAQLPIWRRGRDPDPGTTLLSAVFDLDEARLSVYPGAQETVAGHCRPAIEIALDAAAFGQPL